MNTQISFESIQNVTLTLSSFILFSMGYKLDILKALESIVGRDHCFFGEDKTFEFNKTLIYSNDQTKSLIYVFPKNAPELKEILKIASQSDLKYWVCSRGQNWGYGTMTPTFEFGIIINLKRMNRIIKIDEDLAFAVIEPGVTYQQLHEHLEALSLNLQIDCNDSSPTCSVIGNALERGIGVTPYADHFGQLCGLEILTPTGETLYTGGGSPSDKSFYIYKYGLGPYIEGLFSQSNFGIVVSAGIQLMVKPKSYCSLIIEWNSDEKYFQSIKDLRNLLLTERIRSRIHLCNDITTLSLLSQYHTEYKGPDPYIPEKDLAQIRKKYGIARWTAAGGLFGSKAEIRFTKFEIRRALKSKAQVRFLHENEIRFLRQIRLFLSRNNIFSKVSRFLIHWTTGKDLKLIEVLENSFSLLRGVPTEFFVRHAYFKSKRPRPEKNVNPAADNCGCMWFAPLVPNTPQDVEAFTQQFKEAFHRFGFDYYAAQLMMPRVSIILLSLFFDKGNSEQYQRAMELYNHLNELSLKLGYKQYRTSTIGMQRLFDENPTLKSFLKSMKKAIDPKDLFAPGKYGI